MISHISQHQRSCGCRFNFSPYWELANINVAKKKLIVVGSCSLLPLSSRTWGQGWSSLLLLEQCSEADGEEGGVGVDQDAEAQGDASQTARPRLKKQFVLFMKQQYFWCKVALRIWRHNQQGVPQANKRGSDHTPNQSSFLEAFYQNWILKKLDQVHKS